MYNSIASVTIFGVNWPLLNFFIAFLLANLLLGCIFHLILVLLRFFDLEDRFEAAISAAQEDWNQGRSALAKFHAWCSRVGSSGVPISFGWIFFWFFFEILTGIRVLAPDDRGAHKILLVPVLLILAAVILLSVSQPDNPSPVEKYYNAHLIGVVEVAAGIVTAYYIYHRLLNDFRFPEHKAVLVMILFCLFFTFILVSGNLLISDKKKLDPWDEIYALRRQISLAVFCLLLAEGYLRFAAPFISSDVNKMVIVLLWVAGWQCFLHFMISVWHTCFPNYSDMGYMYELNMLLANHILTWIAVELTFGAWFT